MKRFFVFLVAICSLMVPTPGQTPDWLRKIEKIRLLSDSREDVFNLFGEPVGPPHAGKAGATYVLDGMEIRFLWTPEPCGLMYHYLAPRGWNVAQFKVESVSVYIHTAYAPNIYHPSSRGLKLADLNINKKDFATSPFSPYDPGSTTYTDEKAGRAYIVNSRGVIVDIFYWPGTPFDTLMCENPSWVRERKL